MKMKSLNRKFLGVALILASVVIFAVLHFCGVVMFRFQGQMSGRYGLQTVHVYWWPVPLFALVITGFLCLVLPQRRK